MKKKRIFNIVNYLRAIAYVRTYYTHSLSDFLYMGYQQEISNMWFILVFCETVPIKLNGRNFFFFFFQINRKKFYLSVAFHQNVSRFQITAIWILASTRLRYGDYVLKVCTMTAIIFITERQKLLKFWKYLVNISINLL